MNARNRLANFVSPFVVFVEKIMKLGTMRSRVMPSVLLWLFSSKQVDYTGELILNLNWTNHLIIAVCLTFRGISWAFCFCQELTSNDFLLCFVTRWFQDVEFFLYYTFFYLFVHYKLHFYNSSNYLFSAITIQYNGRRSQQALLSFSRKIGLWYNLV